MSHISPIKQRLRLRFGKFGPLRYTGNLDIAKTWERVLRRANLPILYSEGFNMRPRIQLASALPLGITSECELLDVALNETIMLDGVIDALLAVSPVGLHIYSIDDVDIHEPALQTRVHSGEYRIEFKDGIDPRTLQEHIDAVLSADQLLKVKKKRKRGKIRKQTNDLRPLIFDLQMDADSHLLAHLAVGDHGNLRPDHLLEEMGLDDTYHHIHRLRLHLKP